ncbi:HEAT repeat domain-containing protein [Aneurinibacillus migulanus]|uniref:HEAT repeat domain-containing protein n=1 Tax=Aneurinibacillus migulanus TaxID=47500 RepID=UPI002E1BA188|nr:HEAT repeat domain-containing protein [Aneurinibacillus migulanus]
MGIDEINKNLQLHLPQNSMECLRLHARKQAENEFFLRLMNGDEIIELLSYLRENNAYKDICPFWTDDHSNYVAIYISGPLKYRVCYVDHEETDLSPAFRSIDTFIHAVEEDDTADWHDLKKDYPSTDSTIKEKQDDLQAVQALQKILDEYEEIDEEIRCQYIFSIMALTPSESLDMLLHYVDDEDMYVQERACEILGFHQYVPARDKLRTIAETGMHNGKLAAKRALEKIRAKRKEREV